MSTYRRSVDRSFNGNRIALDISFSIIGVINPSYLQTRNIPLMNLV